MAKTIGKSGVEDPARLFAALGDSTRWRLISSLCDGEPKSISQLTSSEHVTRQAVTKHLEILEHAGLVRSLRHGRERLWDLEVRRLEIARAYLQEVSKRWDQALLRLKNLVED